MAAGCIPVCYEAYGGRDFLRDGDNAYVFPNNYIYPLINKLFELMENYDTIQDELSIIRSNAQETASYYTEERMEKELISFYKSVL